MGRQTRSRCCRCPARCFALRKLLPQTADYDFNVHVMDFQPGEYLFVKEVCPSGPCIFCSG